MFGLAGLSLLLSHVTVGHYMGHHVVLSCPMLYLDVYECDITRT